MTNVKFFLAFFPLALAMSLVSLVAAFACNRKGAYRDFEAFLVCALGILVGNWAELRAATPAASVLWCRLTYIFIGFLPVFWILFSWRSVGRFASNRRLLFGLLSVIPLATIILQFTNDYHRLVWRSYRFAWIDGCLVNDIEAYGPWFWVHVAYSYGLYAWGAVELLGDCLVRQRFYRLRSSLTCLAVGLPILVNVLYVARGSERAFWDPSAIFFSLSGLLLTIVMTKFKLFALAPPSRRALFESFDEGITVLNEEGVVVDMNRSALLHFGFGAIPLGANAARLPEMACLGLDARFLRALPSRGADPGIARSPIGNLQYQLMAKDMAGANCGRVYVIRTRIAPADRDAGGCDANAALSPREEAIYELLITDMSNKEIAFELKVSENTLKTHIKHILKKLACANREDLKNRGQARG